MITSAEYWKAREEQVQREYELTEAEYVSQLNSIYDYMLDQVKKEVNGFYAKYATTEGISMAEAKKRVAEADVEEYERKAKKYVEEKDFSSTANQEMRLYNLTMKVNRLQLLEANIGLETVSGFDELSKVLGSDLTERAVQEMARQAGILGMTVKDSAKAAASIVGASFHNATFSDRIWMYQAQLRDELDSLLRSGLIQGYGPLELARYIDKLFDSGRYNAERLLRTELTRVQSDAQLQSFIANGFDEYQFNALGDACPACAALDEKHFKIADMQVGENAPPVHPRCRCSISAYADDASYNEWLDSYPNHGMSYQDWLENRATAVEDGKDGAGNNQGNSPENEYGLKSTAGGYSVESAIGTEENPLCNPHFKEGGQYTTNCGYCSATYEMRRRGFNVEANPSDAISVSDWIRLYKDADYRFFSKAKNLSVAESLTNTMKNIYPDGARGSIFVKWNCGGGHFFSWEINGEDVLFVDAQCGKIGVESYFDEVKPSSIMHVRWDNLEPSDMITTACKNKE